MNLGNDPVLLLKELERVIYQNLNENKEQLKIKISATTDRVPTLDSYSPEECYLEWQIKYPESVADETILDVFEFVENDCNLFITYEDNAGTMSDDHEHDDPSQLHQENSGLQTNNDPTKKTDNREAQIQSIRVDIDRIDKIVNMVGEMVIKQAMVIDQANIFENELGSSNKSIVDELMKGIQDLTQHTRDLQETVMAIRAQPVKTVFSRLPRLVREVSHELNKEIRLETQGENTEIDKTVIERLGEPLTHLVRNAVDHGIETPEEREAQNKPREGLLVISAGHRSGRIVIEIKDDGRGINRERVLQKAKEKGLVPTDANPTEEEIDQMIFMPGFSTAATVSNISGRGVGMDVVRKTIQGIGGRISIQSELNKGTTFTLTLPLTLAVLDGMLVSVGQECMIIPLINILETIRPSLEQIRPIMDGSHILRLRNEIIPIIYLYQVFNIEDAITDVSEAILVVVETEGGDKVGIVVDQMIGQQQAVIKSLETNYESINGISGATILGNGRVSLILDVSALRFLNKKMFKSQNVSKSTPLGSEDRPHDYTNV